MVVVEKRVEKNTYEELRIIFIRNRIETIEMILSYGVLGLTLRHLRRNQVITSVSGI